ncbi:hypothetical protein EDD29_2368 [Actinocorallia herbida]|uniref:Fibronectin type-III domain-containing protein n=1 Tax=Actinocorallia herbida TaxID=58109 RepID=A0A3N1CU56_9ACTN|nr:hypothetical protein [Actinocorallia herbida]ROO84839.1 hypothetical protein EDD29_2368 [Actinocorallia herbida]
MSAHPLRLPQFPGILDYPRLSDALSGLGCRDLIAFALAGRHPGLMVLDGLRVMGSPWSERVDPAYLESVGRDRAARAPEAAGHVRDLLDVVVPAAVDDPAALWRLVLYQLAAGLRGGSQQEIAGRLKELRIDAGERRLLGPALLAWAAGPEPPDVELLASALSAGALHGAAEAAARVSARPVHDPLLRATLADVRRRATEIRALFSEAADHERHGDVEKAAGLYLRVADLTSDEPGLEEALQRCAPRRPAGARAEQNGTSVVLTWEAPRTGGHGYRISRDGAPVAEVRGTTFTDHDPPIGIPLAYEIRTVRAASSVSEPARPGPVTVAPAAEEFAVESVPGGIAGHWRVGPQSRSVEVTRQDGGYRARFPPDADGFLDPDVRPGTAYSYRLRCMYGQVASADLTADAIAELWPPPALAAETTIAEDGSGVLLTLTETSVGAVVLLRVPAAPPEPGTALDPQALPGVELARWSAGRSVFVPLAAAGRHRLLAVTLHNGRAVAGAAWTVEVRPEVERLEAAWQGEAVRLSWEWPPGIGSAEVSWATGAQEITRSRYRERGFTAQVSGPGTHRFEVRAGNRGGLVLRRPAVVALEGPAEIGYTVTSRKIRRFARDYAVTLAVRGRPRDPVDLVVVAKDGGLVPRGPDDGRRVLMVTLTPETPDQVHDLGTVRGPARLKAFLVGPAARRTLLRHSAPEPPKVG